jgi:hypothetical protein
MLKAFVHSPALRIAAANETARWGLVGVIYTISAGWLIRCFIVGYPCRT